MNRLKYVCLSFLVLSCLSCAASQSSDELTPDASTNLIEPTLTSDTGDAATDAATESASADTALPSPEAATSEIAAAPFVNQELEPGVQLQQGDGFTRFVIQSANEPLYETTLLENPPRLVVDLLGQKNSPLGNHQVAVNNNQFVNNVRFGSHSDKTRVVFDLSSFASDISRAEHLIEPRKDGLRITFVDLSSANSQALLHGEEPAVAAVTTDSKPAETAAATTEVAPIEVAAVAGTTEATPKEKETASAKDSLAAASKDPTLELQKLVFSKTMTNPGQVVVSLSGERAYQLEQTTPTEFVLKIAKTSVSDQSKLPQISPMAQPGIRSARAVQNGKDALVRMFVDGGVELFAQQMGTDIVVDARTVGAAAANARAQLAEPKDGEAKDAEDKAAGDEKTEDESAAGAGPSEQKVEVSDVAARSNPTGVVSADGSKVYRGRLISLDLQDTDIDNALRIIAEVSNLNIIASDEVQGKVTLRLIDVPWDQALDVILKTNGLDQVAEGNVIRIAPVDKLRQEREALREAKRAAENLEDLRVKYYRISYARVTDIKEQVESVLSERGSISVDERTNQLIVKDIGKGHEEAAALLKRLDLRTPQVLLETQIVEAQRDILRDLGFQWNFQYNQSPKNGNATGQNFPNSITVGGGTTDANNAAQSVNFPAALTSAAGSAVSAVLDSADGSRLLSSRLSALETEGRVKVVSRPQVATVNNKQAEIQSVETIRIRPPSSGLAVATGSGASASGGGSTAFEEIKVGINLEVTPQASPDYYVLLDVHAKSSTFGSRQVDNIPSTLEREATSTILVKSGQTFALGGVYRLNDTDQVQGVPFLKDIPFLGHAFRRSFVDKGDEELIFFITPHIVEGSFDPSSF